MSLAWFWLREGDGFRGKKEKRMTEFMVSIVVELVLISMKNGGDCVEWTWWLVDDRKKLRQPFSFLSWWSILISFFLHLYFFVEYISLPNSSSSSSSFSFSLTLFFSFFPNCFLSFLIFHPAFHGVGQAYLYPFSLCIASSLLFSSTIFYSLFIFVLFYYLFIYIIIPLSLSCLGQGKFYVYFDPSLLPWLLSYSLIFVFFLLFLFIWYYFIFYLFIDF